MDHPSPSPRPLQRVLAVGSIIFFIAAAAVGAHLMGKESIALGVAAAGPWAPLVFVLIKSTTIVIAPLSGGPVYLAAVPLFGFTKGASLLWIADMLGYTIVFLLGRGFGHRLLRYLFSEKDLAKAGTVMDHISTWKGFLTARMLMWGFGDVVSYAASLTKLPFAQYLAVSAVLASINVLAMSSLGEFLIKNAQSYVVVIIALAVVPLLLLTFGKRIRAAANSLYGSMFKA